MLHLLLITLEFNCDQNTMCVCQAMEFADDVTARSFISCLTRHDLFNLLYVEQRLTIRSISKFAYVQSTPSPSLSHIYSFKTATAFPLPPTSLTPSASSHKAHSPDACVKSATPQPGVCAQTRIQALK